MAMNVKIAEVRPKKHYFWLLGLSVLIVVGVVLTRYDIARGTKYSTSKISKTGIREYAVKTNHTTSTSTGTLRTEENSSSSVNAFRNRAALSKESHFIVFAKVHKAASSVIQNMLLRFALSRKLNVLLPSQGHILSESSSRIDERALLPLPQKEQYNILCNHVIFNKMEMQKFFPESTKYIGIIRHPLRQLSSALYYYANRYKKSNYPLVYKRHPKNPLLGFLSSPYLYDLDYPNYSYVNNRMSVDLGFPVSRWFEQLKHDRAKIDRFISDLDKTFDLLLIVELFDESLVLLRRMLNWKTEDILYMKLNVRPQFHQFKAEDAELRMHKKWAPIDYALYSFFRTKLEKEIIRQGDDFQRELSSYRTIQKKTLQFCEPGTSTNVTKTRVRGTKWSKEFVLTKQVCDYMSEGETSMVAIVRGKQRKRLGLH